MFTQTFREKYAADGHSIACTVNGFDCIATLHHDSDTTPQECGMPDDAVQSWNNGEWQYVGVAVTIYKNGIRLTGDYDNALWGVECNYPDSDNSYLRDVANELLSEAIEQAKNVIATLCERATS